MKFISYIKYISLCALLVLTALSYHPRFSSFVTDDDAANPLSRYILIMTFITFGLNVYRMKWRDNQFIVFYAKSIGIAALFSLVVSAMFASSSYISETKNILMAFVFLLLGYNSNLNKKQIIALVFIYALAVSYSVYFQIVTNIGGFRIADRYLQYGKNTLGVMTASSCIALLYISLHANNKYLKILGWGLFFILLLFTITIRARAAFVSIFVLSAYIIYKSVKDRDSYRFRLAFILLLCLLILAIGSFSSIGARFLEYIYDSFTQNQGDDLTSGRMSRNIFALQLLGESTLWGNLSLGYSYEWIHNYLLRILSSYGVIGSLPLVVLYLYIVINIIKKIKENKLQIEDVGYIVLLLPLIISLEEPTFPYAPGTGIIFPYVLLGISFAYQKQGDQMLYM